MKYIARKIPRKIKMLVTELVNNINFNDSCVNKIVFSNRKVTMNIDLCMWKQKGYKEGDTELKEVDITFFDVTNYNWVSDKSEEEIDYDTIIEIKVKDNKIEIILVDEEVEVSKVSVLSFECIQTRLNYVTI